MKLKMFFLFYCLDMQILKVGCVSRRGPQNGTLWLRWWCQSKYGCVQ